MKENIFLCLSGAIALCMMAGAIHAVEARHPPEYVGESTCESCHPAEAADWRRSHHAQAMMLPTRQNIRGAFDGRSLSADGKTATFLTQGERFVVRVEENGQSAHDYDVAYTFGVFPLQQYLLAIDRGRLQAFDFAWDARTAAQGGQRWFALQPGKTLKPGDPLHWTGRDYNWNSICAPCHSTGLRKNYDASQDSYHTTFSDIDVACESCHGPGTVHVAWARSAKKTAENTSDPVKGLLVVLGHASGGWSDYSPQTGIRHWVGPRRTSQTLEICAPCHVRAEALSDPLPGAPLLDSRVPTSFDQDIFQADGQIEAEDFEYTSFLQSKMFRAGVICADCHEPHSLSLRKAGNALCGQCHAPARFDTAAHYHHPQGSPGSQCSACHMPTRVYMGVHVRHDHSFRIPRPDLTENIGVTNACAACHADKSAAFLAQKIREWTGASPMPHYGDVFAAARAGAPGAEHSLESLAADPAFAPIVRANALTHINDDATTLKLIETSLHDPDGLVRLAALRALQPYDAATKQRLAWPLLDDPLKAVRVGTARLLGFLAPQLGGEDAAHLTARVDEWIATQRDAAERPESHLNIGALKSEQGRTEEAAEEYRAALKLDAHYLPATLNLADLDHAAGREDESFALLQEAYRLAPDEPDAVYAFALAQVRRGDKGAAETTLRAGLRRHPNDARLTIVLALVLKAEGNAAAAGEVLKAALQANPNDAQIQDTLQNLQPSSSEP